MWSSSYKHYFTSRQNYLLFPSLPESLPPTSYKWINRITKVVEFFSLFCWKLTGNTNLPSNGSDLPRSQPLFLILSETFRSFFFTDVFSILTRTTEPNRLTFTSSRVRTKGVRDRRVGKSRIGVGEGSRPVGSGSWTYDWRSPASTTTRVCSTVEQLPFTSTFRSCFSTRTQPVAWRKYHFEG